MVELIVLPLIELVFYYLIRFPGAVIRWALNGGKRPLRELLEKDKTYRSFFVGFSFFFATMLIYSILK